MELSEFPGMFPLADPEKAFEYAVLLRNGPISVPSACDITDSMGVVSGMVDDVIVERHAGAIRFEQDIGLHRPMRATDVAVIGASYRDHLITDWVSDATVDDLLRAVDAVESHLRDEVWGDEAAQVVGSMEHFLRIRPIVALYSGFKDTDKVDENEWSSCVYRTEVPSELSPSFE